jgi:hypothetical protein
LIKIISVTQLSEEKYVRTADARAEVPQQEPIKVGSVCRFVNLEKFKDLCGRICVVLELIPKDNKARVAYPHNGATITANLKLSNLQLVAAEAANLMVGKVDADEAKARPVAMNLNVASTPVPVQLSAVSSSAVSKSEELSTGAAHPPLLLANLSPGPVKNTVVETPDERKLRQLAEVFAENKNAPIALGNLGVYYSLKHGAFKGALKKFILRFPSLFSIDETGTVKRLSTQFSSDAKRFPTQLSSDATDTAEGFFTQFSSDATGAVELFPTQFSSDATGAVERFPAQFSSDVTGTVERLSTSCPPDKLLSRQSTANLPFDVDSPNKRHAHNERPRGGSSDTTENMQRIFIPSVCLSGLLLLLGYRSD